MQVRPTRKKYDSFVINLYNQNREYLLPASFTQQIPHSTRSTWRGIDYDDYAGSEFRAIQNESLDYYELFLEYKNLKSVFRVIARTWITLSGILQPVLQKKKQYTEIFVNEIQRLSSVIPKKLALHIAGLSVPAFEYQLQKLKQRCGLSVFGLCPKRFSLQLSSTEINTIKKLFADPRFVCWPALSIFHYARRTGILSIAESTFYKYINVLGLKRKWLRAVEKKEGVQSTRPNEFLHVDTTQWELPNGVKAYVVFVSDNFSRAILGYSVSLRCNAENVIQALRNAMETLRKYYPNKVKSSLACDGGSENNNTTVEDLLKNSKHPLIARFIAQTQEFLFSNSPVEAVNKIVKRYLRYYRPQNFEQLLLCIKNIVHDYCFVRPHGSLDGLLPMEAYTGKTKVPDFRKQIQKAREQRIIENKKANCAVCK